MRGGAGRRDARLPVGGPAAALGAPAAGARAKIVLVWSLASVTTCFAPCCDLESSSSAGRERSAPGASKGPAVLAKGARQERAALAKGAGQEPATCICLSKKSAWLC